MFMQDEIREQYDLGDLQDMLEDISLQGMVEQRFASAFGEADLECTVYGFRDAVFFHFPVEDHRGLVVSIDRTTEIDLDEIVDIVHGAIGLR